VRTARSAAYFTAGAVALLGACGGSDLVLPSDGQPTAITAAQGSGQAGRVQRPLPDSLVARVSDARGRPVVGARVAFVVTAGGAGAAVAPDTATTNGDGSAKAQWVLGADAGTQTVAARVVGSSGAKIETAFEASAAAAGADSITLVGGDNQAAPPGQVLADSLVVRVVDTFGNAVKGVTVHWAAIGGGSVSTASSVSGADGRAGTRRTLGQSIGQYNTTATASGLRGSPRTFTAIAAYAPGTQPGSIAAHGGDGQSGTVGAAVAIAPSVIVRDPGGQPMAGVAVSFRIASGGGSIGSGGAVTDGGGIASAGSWTLGTTAGKQTVVASIGANGVSGNPVTFTATASPGPADPATTDANVPATVTIFTPVTITVRTRDAHGNALTRGGANIGVVLHRGKSQTPLSVSDQGDGTYTSTATFFGGRTYTVAVTLGGQPVKGSPYPLQVTSGN
jgi:adhesin/invasin